MHYLELPLDGVSCSARTSAINQPTLLPNTAVVNDVIIQYQMSIGPAQPLTFAVISPLQLCMSTPTHLWAMHLHDASRLEIAIHTEGKLG